MAGKAVHDKNNGRAEKDVEAYRRWSARTSLADNSAESGDNFERSSASSARTESSDAMAELVKTVGFILRLPIFCAGIVLWAAVVMPAAFLLMLAQIIGIPFVFLSAAFNDDAQKFRDHIDGIFRFEESLRMVGGLKSWLFRPRQ